MDERLEKALPWAVGLGGLALGAGLYLALRPASGTSTTQLEGPRYQPAPQVPMRTVIMTMQPDGTFSRSPVDSRIQSVKEQVSLARTIDWARLKKVEELVHFQDITPDLLFMWQSNEVGYLGSRGMVELNYLMLGSDGQTVSQPVGMMPGGPAASIARPIERLNALAFNFADRPRPNLTTFDNKFEDPWVRQQSSQGYDDAQNGEGEMSYLRAVPPVASMRIAAIFEKANRLGGRANPSMDDAHRLFDQAWEQYAKAVNAKRDEYAGYVLKAAVMSGQPYLIAAATIFAGIMKLIPMQSVFGNKEREEAFSGSVNVLWTALVQSAVPSVGRVLKSDDLEGEGTAELVDARINAQLRNTLLPKEAILPLQTYWALAMRSSAESRGQSTEAGTPTVDQAFRALGGKSGWCHLANDEQVVLVGLPIAHMYGFSGRKFCEMLWERAKGWSAWPALLYTVGGPDGAEHPCNAWSVQWFDLVMTAFQLAEDGLRGNVVISGSMHRPVDIGLKAITGAW